VVRDDEHVVLVGLMGTGKSTVGKVLAERLRRSLFDTDAMCEARTGRTVRAMFVEDGEPVFRALESEVLADALAGATPVVVAAAGGVVLAEQNRRLLREAKAKVVWLSADPALLVERARSGGHRPALDADPAGTLRAMASAREPLYREVADLVISVDGRSVGDVVEAVLR
jgi:shikimate kinase